MSDFKQGTYTKGERVRHVDTPADAVQAQWDGFAVSEDASTESGEDKGSEDGYDSLLDGSPEYPEDGVEPASETGTSTTSSNPFGDSL